MLRKVGSLCGLFEIDCLCLGRRPREMRAYAESDDAAVRSRLKLKVKSRSSVPRMDTEVHKIGVVYEFRGSLCISVEIFSIGGSHEGCLYFLLVFKTEMIILFN